MTQGTKDLSSYSKEELINLLLQEREQHANTRKHFSNVLNNARKLRMEQIDKATALENENNILKATVAEQNKIIQNNSICIKNIITFAKENQVAGVKIFSEDYIPNFETAEAHELNEYLQQVVIQAHSATIQLIGHRNKSLNLSQSEKNNRKAKSDSIGEGSVSMEGNDDFDENSQEAPLNPIVTNATDADKSAEAEPNKQMVAKPRKKVTHTAQFIACQNIKQGNFTFDNLGDLVMQALPETKRTEISLKLIKDGFKEQGLELDPANPPKQINNDIYEVVVRVPRGTIEAYCPVCNKIHEFKINSKAERINVCISAPIPRLSASLVHVSTAYCEYSDKTISLRPDTFTKFELIESKVPAGKVPFEEQVKNSSKTTEQDSQAVSADEQGACRNDAETEIKQARNAPDAQGERHRRDASHAIVVDPNALREVINLRDWLVKSQETMVIDPCQFSARGFDLLPVFAQCECSHGLMTNLASYFSTLTAPKNRISTFYSQEDISKAEVINWINSFARAYLHPVANRIRHMMLRNNHCVLIDETTLKIRELQRNKNIIKAQIWTMVSGRSEGIRAAYFMASETRNASNVFKLLDDSARSIEYVVSDAFSGYNTAERQYAEDGAKIQFSGCWTHARRPLHRYLDSSGILKIYNSELLPAGCSYTDFFKNLAIKRQDPKLKKRLTDSMCDLLTIYYLLNALFVIDGMVAKKHDFNFKSAAFMAELQQERQQRSVKIADTMYFLISHYIEKYLAEFIKDDGGDGTLKLLKSDLHPESGPLIYLLNQQKALRKFSLSPVIELSQSGAERALRLGVCARRSFEFMESMDGAHAFADYLTIANTCIMNGVNIPNYLIWLIANFKVRMEDMVLNQTIPEPNDFSSKLYFKPQKKINEKANADSPDEEKRFGIYHEKNPSVYDLIDITGLTPMDYAAYKQARK